MSITNFREKMKGGGARPNQFKVGLFFPSGISVPGATSAGQAAEFMCEATSLPGQTVGITPVMYRGREVKLAGERTFDNWQITVINDGNFSIHTAIEQWMNSINNLRENTGSLPPNSYVTDLTVEQLDRNMQSGYGGAGLKKYKMFNTWPVSVSAIALSFADNNNVERFQVDFALDWFESTATNTAL